MDIKKIREKAFLTQMEFAKELGLCVATIRKWEQGKGNPSLRHLKLVVEFAKKNGIEL